LANFGYLQGKEVAELPFAHLFAQNIRKKFRLLIGQKKLFVGLLRLWNLFFGPGSVMREWIRGEWHTMCPAIAAFVILPKNEGRQTICCQVVCGSRVSSTLLTSCPRLFGHDLPLVFDI